MLKQLSLQTLLDAINALGIDVPVMRTEQDANGAITIYLYGGEIRHWPPAGQAEIASPDPLHSFTPPPVTRSELAKSKKAASRKKVQAVK